MVHCWVENVGIEGLGVPYIGKLDRKLYRCVSDDIITDEVIITEKQILHIMERHPLDYERFSGLLQMIIESPDYILEANKPYTAVILKEVAIGNAVFKTILRLATSVDNPSYKNSVITFMKIDKKDWDRLIRNKTILYKRG